MFKLHSWLKYFLFLVIPLLFLTGCTAPHMLAGGIATGIAVNEPRRINTVIQDQILRHQIDKCIARETNQDSNIKANTYNQVVLLTGQTTDAQIRQAIEEYVSAIPKVKQVFNQITLQPPLYSWQRMKDVMLSSYIRMKLLLAGHVRSTCFRILVENQHVFILGKSEEKQAERAAHIAQRTLGVQQVIRVIEPI